MNYAGLVWANLGRNKLRSGLTFGAVSLAIMLVVFLLTMPAGLDALLNSIASNTRVSVHNKAGIVYSIPFAYVRKVRLVDGVAGAVGTTWFGGAYEEEGRVTFPNFAVEAEHVGLVYPDYGIAPNHLEDFRRYRDGAIVGRQTMRRYGWKVGDRITLKSTAWAVNLDLRIVGEIPIERSPVVWIQRDYLDEALIAQRGQGLGIVHVIWVRVADPNRVDEVMRTIDDMFRNSEAETASETEKSFFGSFFGSLKGFMTIVLLVTLLVAICVVVIAANTASMSIRERGSEIAVFKALGFPRRIVFAVLLAESAVLCTAAGLLGVGLAYGFTYALRTFAAVIPSLGPLGSFLITPSVALQGIFLSLFVGFVAGLVPAWGAARKPLVEALHEIF
ncbi:MAG: ABC transporter ATP-binding protein [Candidatus Binatia bacterium]|nr:MAG: ABC transporter ATP-binding protein [Candidatus Binatia bacterium]